MSKIKSNETADVTSDIRKYFIIRQSPTTKFLCIKKAISISIYFNAFPLAVGTLVFVFSFTLGYQEHLNWTRVKFHCSHRTRIKFNLHISNIFILNIIHKVMVVKA